MDIVWASSADRVKKTHGFEHFQSPALCWPPAPPPAPPPLPPWKPPPRPPPPKPPPPPRPIGPELRSDLGQWDDTVRHSKNSRPPQQPTSSPPATPHASSASEVSPAGGEWHLDGVAVEVFACGKDHEREVCVWAKEQDRERARERLKCVKSPSNQSMAALAEGGSSKETVASPFSLPVSLSVYRLIMGRPVFLLTWSGHRVTRTRVRSPARPGGGRYVGEWDREPWWCQSAWRSRPLTRQCSRLPGPGRRWCCCRNYPGLALHGGDNKVDVSGSDSRLTCVLEVNQLKEGNTHWSQALHETGPSDLGKESRGS